MRNGVSGMGRSVRKALVVIVACVTVLGLAQVFASAAPPAIAFVAPSPAEGATLTTNSVEFKFTSTKKPNATRTMVCALAGPTPSTGPCDAPVASGSKGSQSGKSYSGLANGSYTFTVLLTLTDGGTATATRHFSIDVPAARHLYWTNDSDPGTIGRANADGTGVNQSFITGASRPVKVAVDATHVYWTNRGTSTIGRANLDGTGVNQNFITGAAEPRGVAVDAGHVYWTNATGTIGRANLDGTGANQNFITGASFPFGVAVDAGHVYWTSNETIGRANLDGTGVNQNFITAASFATAVAVDAGHVYWANSNTGTIGRANLDGTGVNQNFITGASDPVAIAVDTTHVYWANQTARTIGRANLDGTDVNQNFITAPSTPQGVAVDAG
jgi:streptogramin lyase